MKRKSGSAKGTIFDQNFINVNVTGMRSLKVAQQVLLLWHGHRYFII